jgi:hypothetical protein
MAVADSVALPRLPGLRVDVDEPLRARDAVPELRVAMVFSLVTDRASTGTTPGLCVDELRWRGQESPGRPDAETRMGCSADAVSSARFGSRILKMN